MSTVSSWMLPSSCQQSNGLRAAGARFLRISQKAESDLWLYAQKAEQIVSPNGLQTRGFLSMPQANTNGSRGRKSNCRLRFQASYISPQGHYQGANRDYEGELNYISNKHLQNIPHR